MSSLEHIPAVKLKRKKLNIELERTENPILDFLRLVEAVFREQIGVSVIKLNGAYSARILAEPNQFFRIEYNGSTLPDDLVNLYFYKHAAQFCEPNKTSFNLSVSYYDDEDFSSLNHEWRNAYLRYLLKILKYEVNVFADNFKDAINPNLLVYFMERVTLEQMQRCFDLQAVRSAKSKDDIVNSPSYSLLNKLLITEIKRMGLFGNDDRSQVLQRRLERGGESFVEFYRETLLGVLNGERIRGSSSTLNLYFELRGTIKAAKAVLDKIDQESE